MDFAATRLIGRAGFWTLELTGGGQVAALAFAGY